MIINCVPGTVEWKGDPANDAVRNGWGVKDESL